MEQEYRNFWESYTQIFGNFLSVDFPSRFEYFVDFRTNCVRFCWWLIRRLFLFCDWGFLWKLACCGVFSLKMIIPTLCGWERTLGVTLLVLVFVMFSVIFFGFFVYSNISFQPVFSFQQTLRPSLEIRSLPSLQNPKLIMLWTMTHYMNALLPRNTRQWK